MVDWPTSIKEPAEVNEMLLTNRFKTKPEAAYVQITKKFTRTKKKFELVWSKSHNTLITDEKEILEEFIKQNFSNIITWANPNDGKIYNVVFEEDSHEFNIVHKRNMSRGIPGFWQAKVNLEEV